MAITDLDQFLTSLKPSLESNPYVFCVLKESDLPNELEWVALFKEKEGLTLVVKQEDAQKYGLVETFKCAWITLTVNSDLKAVGLTAAVSAALTRKGISCNVIAAYHHDHLFVPWNQREEAMDALNELSKGNVQQDLTSPV